MYSTSCCLIFIVAASTAAAVFADTKATDNPQPPNSTVSTTSASATPKSSDDDPEDDLAETGPRKRTIEQTAGYGYRYNSVLRPGSTVVASLRNRPAYQHRGASASPITPSPTPASYYFQQQQVLSTSPKPVHRFAGPLAAYTRYSRPEPSETRPVTESPLPITAAASLQPHQDLYREVFTFDEAVSSPYHIAPRAEHPQIIPQALFLTPASPHHPQQVIPVLILRLDPAAPFPYPMMAILREDTMPKMYSPHEAALQLHHYSEPASHEAPTLAYYTPEAHHQARRVQPMSPSQPDPYRGAQDPMSVVGKALGRRPSPATSAAGNSAPQGTRTEVTIHHSPGVTAQDYKESVEQEEEA